MSTGNKTYQIAAALVDAPNATYAAQFTAVLASVPLMDLDAMGDDINVTVVPGEVTDERIARTQWLEEHTVTIGIQKKLGTDTECETQAVVAVADTVKKWLRQLDLTAAGVTSPKSIRHSPIVSTEHFRQYRVASSILSVSYNA